MKSTALHALTLTFGFGLAQSTFAQSTANFAECAKEAHDAAQSIADINYPAEDGKITTTAGEPDLLDRRGSVSTHKFKVPVNVLDNSTGKTKQLSYRIVGELDKVQKLGSARKCRITDISAE